MLKTSPIRLLVASLTVLAILAGSPARGAPPVVFDGAETPLPLQQWHWLDTAGQPGMQEIATQLSTLNWRPLAGTSPALNAIARTLRIDIDLRYRGAQRPLLVIPNAYVPTLTVAWIHNGRLLLEQPLGASMKLADKPLPHAFTILPLPTVGPGNYQLLVRGSGSTNTLMVRGSTLYLENEYAYRDLPRSVSMVAGFAGILLTYLLLCLVLLAFKQRAQFAYAMIFLAGAFSSLMVREGLLFLLWELDVTWWNLYAMQATIGATLAGAILYVREDIGRQRWPRLHTALGVFASIGLALSFTHLFVSVGEILWFTLLGLGNTILGTLLALFLICVRAFSGNARDRLFAACFGWFFLVLLERFWGTFVVNAVAITPLVWNLSITLAATYIFVEYALTLTHDYVSEQTRKTADLTRIDLVNRLSHELRTPLNAVIGLADLLKDSNDIGKVHSYAGMIHSAGHNLLDLVNDILDFSKLGTTGITLTRERLRLDQLITDVLTGFLPRIMETGIVPQTLTDPSLPCFLLGDELRLKQIVSNLISNALKFSSAGGNITLRVTLGQSDNKRVELLWSVSDTGRGIPPDKIATIFEPYVQAEAEDSGKLQGTGLGLAICKQLVEQMRGQISVSSELGQGTMFSFNTWLEIDPDAPDLANLLAPLQGKRILLVSKLNALTAQMKLYLEYWGARLQVAESLPQLTASETPGFDLVICDSIVSTSASDRDWFAKLPPTTAIHFFELQAMAWTQQIPHPNIRTLAIPCPIISVMVELIEHMSGTHIELPSIERRKSTLTIRHHRVLLVDDNIVNLTVAGKLLSSLDVRCDTAQGGASALSKLKEGERYSLMLLDCEMPGINGFEVSRLWRQYEREHQRQPLTVVALTAHALNEVRDQCLAVGMNEVLYKPVGREALIQLLNRYPGLEVSQAEEL